MDWKIAGAGIAVTSFLAGVYVLPSLAASPQVEAAETSLYIDANFMHTHYSEHLVPGDRESGLTPGFGVGASAMLPTHPGNPGSVDIYTAINYDFDAGHIHYNGHFQPAFGGGPVQATDRAVFNRIEARIGIGFPLLGGGESIPFFAAGYQAWNRNIANKGTIGTDEFYHSGLFGLGWKFDQPIGKKIVASATGEFLGLAGGGITANGTNFGRGFGVTPEERVEVGLDDAVQGRFHVFAKAYVEHFNYSVTTQFGVNVGVGYTFN
jgi:hypothetical protein